VIGCAESTALNQEKYKKKLDARQSLTLARPAAPLAAYIQRPPCTTTACVQRPTCTTFATVRYRHVANVTEAPKLSSVAELNSVATPKLVLPRQRPLRAQKTNSRLIIYSHSSTDPKNMAKIGRVEFKITGLTEIVKKETEAERKPAFGCCFKTAGRANNSIENKNRYSQEKR